MGHKVTRQIKAGKMDAVAVTLDRIKKRPRNALGRLALHITGEYAVHVQIEQRHAALDRVDAQRIHGRVNIDGAVQVFWVPLQLLI